MKAYSFFNDIINQMKTVLFEEAQLKIVEKCYNHVKQQA